MLELESRVSELQCDNLRMEQRLLDMEYSSYSTTKRIEGGGIGGMTLIDDVLRDYSRHTQLVDNDKSNDVNAKRKSIVDVEDELSDKVCVFSLSCLHLSKHDVINQDYTRLIIPCCCFILYKRSRHQSSSLLEPGTVYYCE